MALTGFKRPTLDQIIRQLDADVVANLPEIDSRLRHTVEYALTRAFAGAMHNLYGYLDWIADQTNALYAEDENLDAFGVLWDVTRKQATRADGTATVTGTNGSVIPVDTVLQTVSGVKVSTTNQATIANGTATLLIEATEYGDEGNIEPGVTLSFISPISGVDSRATVVTMDGGADLENNTLYRQRILARIHQAPHGGSKKDYVDWATSVPGVTRAWCYPLENGPGTVVVRFMMDEAYTNGIPHAEDVITVRDYIEARRPVTATVSVLAPLTQAVNITISALTPDNPETRAAATQELRDMFRREASPGGTLYYSWFWDAVSQATGARHHRIVAPATDVSAPKGTIPVLGTVSFVP